ncbi:tetratricopeptide repeat protein [Flagellimonas oceanensis]|uniref:tetratricopeptide repeat protein n=1 Tax=Flagellimonas oceanensis TaxID=2499163 RepID=UPI003BA9DC54
MIRKTKYIYITFLILFFSKADAQTSALAVADSLYALGNYTSAINAYAKVGGKKSNLQIARAYNTIGNYDKAIAQYRAVLDNNPGFDWIGRSMYTTCGG